MAHGKAAARDLQWGRQGGGWQESTAAEALAAIDRARRDPANHWPTVDQRPRPDDPTPCSTCGQPYGAHQAGPCPICGFPLDHHPDQQPTAGEWQALARMAATRQAAGIGLSDTDLEALRRAGLDQLLHHPHSGRRDHVLPAEQHEDEADGQDDSHHSQPEAREGETQPANVVDVHAPIFPAGTDRNRGAA